MHIESTISWRLLFLIQGVFALTLAASCLWLPSSPRWLLLKGRRDEALHSIDRLDIPQAEAEKDILRPASPTAVSDQSQGFLAMFKKEYRGRTLLAFFIMGMLQFSGIDGVLYVSLSLYEQPICH